MERTSARKSLREALTPNRLKALLFAGGLVLAGCGGATNGDEGEPASQQDTTIAEAGSTTTEAMAPFEVRQEWSLPQREQLSPRVMTPELCEDFWEDEDGKRRELVQEEPPIVRVDGRCNTPLDNENAGIYFAPQQQGKAPVVVVNGDALGVECHMPGQAIQDIRGPRSSSEVWLGVVTDGGEVGLIPEANVGYFDESKVRTC